MPVLCAMIKQEREQMAEKAIRDLVEVFRESGAAVPAQVRHALSAVNGAATINGKPERVGLDRALSLIEKNAPYNFEIVISITKK